MNKPLHSAAFKNPFQSSTPSLAEVDERVSTSSLPKTRKRDCRSALRRFGELTGRDLSTIPADLPEIRRSLDALHPARVGLTAKTWTNLRSNLLASLEVAGVGAVMRTNKVRLSSQWTEFRALLTDRRSSGGLSRFMRFCSLHQVAPGQVNDDVLRAFSEALRQGTLARHAKTLERDVATLWNRVAETTCREAARPLAATQQSGAGDPCST